MSDESILDKLTWLFLLLPGVVCIATIGSIVELPEWTEFQFTCYSLILSVMVGVVAWPAASGVNWLLGRFAPAYQLSRVAYLYFCVALLLAVVVGAVLGVMAQNDSTLRLLRSLPGMPVIDKASARRPLVMILSYNNKADTSEKGLKTHGADGRPVSVQQEKAYLRLGIKDGPVYEGWPQFFAHGEGPSELYLSPACRIDANGVATIVPGAGVIMMESEIQYIELIDVHMSTCRKHYYP